ncbi:MAG: hypothetical protein K6T17_02035 [Fimbriimonadales bacterium]|nr:hypothetical protein [Fimbriimonadales bacterium]
MHKIRLLFACLLLTTFASSSYPQAFAPLGVKLRFGVFWPSAVDARGLGKQWLLAGVEYDIMRFPLTPQGRLTFSADAFGRSDALAIPAMVNFVQKGDKYHYFAGAGAAFVDRPGFENSVQFCYQVGLGYQVIGGPNPITAELRWISIANVSSFLDGFAFTVGVKL